MTTENDAKDANFSLFASDLKQTKKPPKKRARFSGNSCITIEQSIDDSFEWQRVPLHARGKHDSSSKKCFGCEYGSVEPDDSHPALKALWKLFAENFGKCSNEALARLMHSLFMKEIYEPMKQQGHKIDEWTVAQIVEHIESHIVEPTINNTNAIRNLRYLEHIMLNNVKLKNKHSEECKVDLKTLRGILEVQKQIQVLFNAKCTRQLMYSNIFKLDDQRANLQEK
jgi:hypothetical protein